MDEKQVFLRWYRDGEPEGAQRMENLHAAQAAVLAKYTTAVFGEWLSLNQRQFISNPDEKMLAWESSNHDDSKPVADFIRWK
jgi:hypothetical protein